MGGENILIMFGKDLGKKKLTQNIKVKLRTEFKMVKELSLTLLDKNMLENVEIVNFGI